MEKCGSVVEVNKPDSYQGREKDFILISCVRSDGSRGLGSLGYIHRFLLALTRAKLGVIIVGNSRALKFVSKIFINHLPTTSLDKVSESGHVVGLGYGFIYLTIIDSFEHLSRIII